MDAYTLLVGPEPGGSLLDASTEFLRETKLGLLSNPSMDDRDAYIARFTIAQKRNSQDVRQHMNGDKKSGTLGHW